MFCKPYFIGLEVINPLDFFNYRKCSTSYSSLILSNKPNCYGTKTNLSSQEKVEAETSSKYPKTFRFDHT